LVVDACLFALRHGFGRVAAAAALPVSLASNALAWNALYSCAHRVPIALNADSCELGDVHVYFWGCLTEVLGLSRAPWMALSSETAVSLRQCALGKRAALPTCTPRSLAAVYKHALSNAHHLMVGIGRWKRLPGSGSARASVDVWSDLQGHEGEWIRDALLTALQLLRLSEDDPRLHSLLVDEVATLIALLNATGDVLRLVLLVRKAAPVPARVLVELRNSVSELIELSKRLAQRARFPRGNKVLLRACEALYDVRVRLDTQYDAKGKRKGR
jgi:hypothetical protein